MLTFALRRTRRAAAAPRCRFLCGALTASALALAAGPALARADSPIEGVWAFNGGSVAITPQPNGAFTGTVLAPTRFARCTHEAGEPIWTDITRQPDGSYQGLHQWFFDTDDCPPNPTLGPSAWRVITTGDGSRFLRVCLSEPAGPQPAIGPGDETAGVGYGCFDSALIAPLPVSTLDEFTTLSAAGPTGCLARKKLRLRFRNPATNPLKRVVVTLRGDGVRRRLRPKPRRGNFAVTINLASLTASTFTVSVRITTVLGKKLRGKRTYERCGGHAA